MARRLTLLWCAAILAGPVTGQAQVSILCPNIGIPAFPLTNGTFGIEVQAAPGLASNGWSVLLLNDLRSWTCAVERVDYGFVVYGNTTTGYLLTARAPATAAEEVFRLRIGHSVAGAATNRHCVSLLSNYETNFYILHYADPQVETVSATAANGAGGAHGSVQSVQWAAGVFSLIHPRFVFNTGDEVENGVAGYYPLYLDAIDPIGAPLLITRGNNDSQGSYANWKRDLGQSTYTLTMGSFYVAMCDYSTNDLRSWFTNDYGRSFTNTAIKYRLIGQHYNSGMSAFAPAAGQYPDLMLVGHNHTFSTLASSPYYILSSGPAWNYGNVGFFEFRKSGDTWSCSNIAVHGGSNKLNAFSDWGALQYVTNRFLVANDGTAWTNRATITNALAQDFWDGRVRFLMRKSATGYTVGGGEKIAEYDYTATNSAVLVKVNIRHNAETAVTVSPTFADAEPPVLAFLVPTNGAVCRTSRSNLWISGTAVDAGGVTSVAWSAAGATVASGSAATGVVALIAPGATWKYLDNGSDQGTAWRALDFDDSAWASGFAELGYGDGDEATTNSYGPDPNNKHVTTYYRRAFEVGDPRVFTNGLVIAAVRDDGILAFLNGAEALRNYMPEGEVTYTTFASSTAAGADETNWQAGAVSAGALTQGLNVVAAEVHQVNLTSSDTSFNLALGADLGGSWLITNAVLASGTNVVSVVARDASGNASTGTLTVVVTDDVDGDGLPDDWEIDHFGDTETSSGGPGDEDEDGFTDWAEYVAGTDPNDEDSFLAVETSASSALGWVIQWPGGTNRHYDIFQSTNLFQPFTELATNLPAVVPLTSYTVPVSAAEGLYLRIKARNP